MTDKTDKKIASVEEEPKVALSELKEMMQTLAGAIIESRKPYVDPRSAANDELFREGARQQEERRKKMVEADQASCEHLQGSNPLSEKTGDLTSWGWHRYDDGVIRGICTNCLRMITPEDSDYVYQFRRKSGNRISSAGRRDYLTTHVPQTVPTPVAAPAPAAAVDPETVNA